MLARARQPDACLKDYEEGSGAERFGCWDCTDTSARTCRMPARTQEAEKYLEQGLATAAIQRHRITKMSGICMPSKVIRKMQLKHISRQ